MPPDRRVLGLAALPHRLPPKNGLATMANPNNCSSFCGDFEMRLVGLLLRLLLLMLGTAVGGSCIPDAWAVDSKQNTGSAAVRSNSKTNTVSQLSGQRTPKPEPRSRTFHFGYDARVNGLPGRARVRAWFPLPRSSHQQNVEILTQKVPAESRIATETTYGNAILYCESNNSPTDSLPFSISFLVQRQEVRGIDESCGPVELTDRQRQRFLSANIRVPLKGRQLDLLSGVKLTGDALDIARMLYNRVDDHVRYDKSSPGYGNGDVLWVCDSRFGNCTDFHSLFISWARAKNIPARFEIGFLLPPECGKGMISGYHCWAMFHQDKKGWIPVDISEADKHPEMKEYYFGNLSENRVAFTTGRDIVLVPPQDGPPLNFFVYPYIEVNGRPWPQEKMELTFSYEDVVAADTN